MYGSLVYSHCRLLDRFRKRGVRVTATGNVLAAGPKLHGHRRLMNQFPGMRSNNVNSQNPICLLVRKNLHKSVRMTGSACSPIGSKGKFS